MYRDVFVKLTVFSTVYRLPGQTPKKSGSADPSSTNIVSVANPVTPFYRSKTNAQPMAVFVLGPVKVRGVNVCGGGPFRPGNL